MTRKSGEPLRMTYGNTGQLFRPYSIHNIIPLLKKKENVDLYSCPWGYDIYMDAYF